MSLWEHATVTRKVCVCMRVFEALKHHFSPSLVNSAPRGDTFLGSFFSFLVNVGWEGLVYGPLWVLAWSHWDLSALQKDKGIIVFVKKQRNGDQETLAAESEKEKGAGKETREQLQWRSWLRACVCGVSYSARWRCAGEGREGVNLEARNQQSKLPRNYLDYLHACPMESLCSQCSSQD